MLTKISTNLAKPIILNKISLAAASTTKKPKLELTLRTPYRTIFQNFTAFTRLYVKSSEGNSSIGNRTIPRVYLLSAGQLSIKNLGQGEGRFTESESGDFIHSGGWLFVHPDNSVEINVVQCEEKQSFNFDGVNANDIQQGDDASSLAGRTVTQLSQKVQKLVLKKR